MQPRLWLIEARRKLAWSCAQAADASGMERDEYMAIELGKEREKIAPWVAQRIANALGFDWRRFYPGVLIRERKKEEE